MGAAASLKELVDVVAGTSIVIVELIMVGVRSEMNVGEGERGEIPVYSKNGPI